MSSWQVAKKNTSWAFVVFYQELFAPTLQRSQERLNKYSLTVRICAKKQFERSYRSSSTLTCTGRVTKWSWCSVSTRLSQSSPRGEHQRKSVSNLPDPHVRERDGTTKSANPDRPDFPPLPLPSLFRARCEVSPVPARLALARLKPTGGLVSFSPLLSSFQRLI